MNNQDYEKAKQECWDAYIAKHGLEYAIPEEAFDFAYDHAHRLGMEAAKKEQQGKPKFKVGDKVSVHYPTGKRIGFIKEVLSDVSYDVDFGGGCTGHGISEYLIEPYTEPKVDKYFDNIVKDGFQNHNRLQIAAMAMQGILSNESEVSRACQSAIDSVKVHSTPEAIVLYALACADALIEESEKKGDKQI